MKKVLVSILLAASLISGCGKTEEIPSVDDKAFQLNTQKSETQAEEVKEDNSKVTATTLLSKFIKDLNTGFTADVVVNENVNVTVDSVKGKSYDTLLAVKQKGSMTMGKDKKVKMTGYIGHSYTYNTNFADVYKFVTSNKAVDSHSLINKKAKEYTQDFVLENDKNACYDIDETSIKLNKRAFNTNLVISDFSNLNFTENKDGYTVKGTIHSKLFGTLFNFEDIYTASKLDNSDCSYNVTFVFDKNRYLQSLSMELVKGTGKYENTLKRISDMYIKEHTIELKNIQFNVDTAEFSLNGKSDKDFYAKVNKF